MRSNNLVLYIFTPTLKGVSVYSALRKFPLGDLGVSHQ